MKETSHQNPNGLARFILLGGILFSGLALLWISRKSKSPLPVPQTLPQATPENASQDPPPLEIMLPKEPRTEETSSKTKFLLPTGILFLCFVLLFIFWRLNTHPPDPSIYTGRLIFGFALTGVAFGVVTIWQQWYSRFNPIRLTTVQWVIGALTGAVFIVSFILHFGMKQFGGFDFSPLVDVGWRLINNQIIYKDFPSPLPIGFTLGSSYAYTLFGVSWSAIIKFQALFAAVTFLWSLWLCRTIFRNDGLAFLIALFIQASTSMVTCYWWYNPFTTVASLVYFLAAVALVVNKPTRALSISYVAALLLLASAKPNLAGVMIMGVTATLMFLKDQRVLVSILTLGAFLGFVSWLGVHGVSILDVVSNYLDVASRGFSLQQFLQDLSPEQKNFALLHFGFLLFIAIKSNIGSDGLLAGEHVRWISLTALIAGIYGFFTNGEVKIIDLALPTLAVFIYAYPRFGKENEDAKAQKEEEPKAVRRYEIFPIAVTALMVTVLFAGLGMGLTRQRVQSIGYGSFFEFALPVPSDIPYFKGLTTGPFFKATTDNIQDVLNKAPGQSVHFGPRLQWGYAAFNLPSPKGLPIWWHPGVSFNALREETYLQKWSKSEFETLIFLKGDFTYYSQAFMNMIVQDYTIDESYPSLTVLQRRK